ncbi:formin-like protein 20 [Herpailurus yagouaroundi]|uniref:formin-like protein 20 n=1 Tax=Herpailurus yagouaroundi TaxID=1608482 RepID=UPI001AD656C5|nr:formin-like protein 20 [Puma yagouaroundi]
MPSQIAPPFIPEASRLTPPPPQFTTDPEGPGVPSDPGRPQWHNSPETPESPRVWYTAPRCGCGCGYGCRSETWSPARVAGPPCSPPPPPPPPLGRLGCFVYYLSEGKGSVTPPACGSMTRSLSGGRTAASDAFGAPGRAHLAARPSLGAAVAGWSRARRPDPRSHLPGDRQGGLAVGGSVSAWPPSTSGAPSALPGPWAVLLFPPRRGFIP